MRTPRGRMLTAEAFRHLGLDQPKTLAQLELIVGPEVADDD